jgi:hypothetical protein
MSRTQQVLGRLIRSLILGVIVALIVGDGGFSFRGIGKSVSAVTSGLLASFAWFGLEVAIEEALNAIPPSVRWLVRAFTEVNDGLASIFRPKRLS